MTMKQEESWKELDPVGINRMYLHAMGVSRCSSLFSFICLLSLSDAVCVVR